MLSFPQVSDNDSKDKTADAKDSFYDSRDCGFITNTQITIPHPSCVMTLLMSMHRTLKLLVQTLAVKAL